MNTTGTQIKINPETFICENCGKIILNKYSAKKIRFCSNKCWHNTDESKNISKENGLKNRGKKYKVEPGKGRDVNKYKSWYKKYYSKNKYKLSLNKKQWNMKNREKIKQLKKLNNIYRNYNLTKEQYNELLLKYNNRCAICDGVQRLSVDHCHSTGVVRGLLCGKCNGALGLFGDNLSKLTKAVEYLREFYGTEL
jgi:hypothetical protein